MKGLALLLFSNTSATDMSLRANTISSIAKATSVSTPWTTAIERIARRTSAPLRRATIISTNWSSASPAASHSAARPVSAIISRGSSGLVLRGQVSELGQHVALVMLGKDRVGHERAVLETAFRDGARSLAEQVGRDSPEHHRRLRMPV